VQGPCGPQVEPDPAAWWSMTWRALSRCRAAVRKGHRLNSVQASTTAACQCAIASALNFRKVDREIRWR